MAWPFFNKNVTGWKTDNTTYVIIIGIWYLKCFKDLFEIMSHAIFLYREHNSKIQGANKTGIDWNRKYSLLRALSVYDDWWVQKAFDRKSVRGSAQCAHLMHLMTMFTISSVILVIPMADIHSKDGALHFRNFDFLCGIKSWECDSPPETVSRPLILSKLL